MLGASIKISSSTQALLRCPICSEPLEFTDEAITCSGPQCRATYPIVEGVPILINEQTSVFTIDDIKSRFNPAGSQWQSNFEKALKRLVPSIGSNLSSGNNYENLATILLARSEEPKVLVVGGRILGKNMTSLSMKKSIELVETDVMPGPRTNLIVDAHDIPFETGSFDGVIAQAVLEHVVDPYLCVDEIFRVLKDDGLIYAETPFMQQVHGGAYDFTRFTHLGHRRLFRHFKEINSGAVGGPGMSLAWSYRYFLLGFTESKILRAMIRAFTGFTAFFLKYFDYYLIDKSAALDAANGIFFLGQKAETTISDRELISLYRGAW